MGTDGNRMLKGAVDPGKLSRLSDVGCWAGSEREGSEKAGWRAQAER